MTLIERLRALGQRREAEGNYTDQNICEAAIEEIERQRMTLERIVQSSSEGRVVVVAKAALAETR